MFELRRQFSSRHHIRTHSSNADGSLGAKLRRQFSSKHHLRTHSSNVDESPEAKLKRAELLYKAGSFGEALSIYSDLLAITPNDASLLYWNGMCLDRLDEKPNAISFYDKAIELNPDDYLVHFARGVAMHDQGYYKDAFASYNRAFELNTGYHAVCYKIGWLGSYFGKDEEAMILYQEASKFEPTNILYFNLIGHAAYSANRKQTAFNSYMRALELNPNDTVCWYNTAIAAFELGKEDQAKTFFIKILENRSKDVIGTLNDIATLPDSLDTYLSSKLNGEVPVEYVRSKAMILELLGEYDAALCMYNEAIKIDPDDALVYHHQGKILYLNEDYKGAIKCFNRALSLDISDLNSYLYNLLSLYTLHNDLEGHTLFPALSTFGQEEDIINFMANLPWDSEDPYIPKEARILLDLILFSKSYSRVFSLFAEKNINFNLKISFEDNTSLFVAIIQTKDEWLISQMLRIPINFEEILKELLRDLDDSTCLDIIQKIVSKSGPVAHSIREGHTKLLEIALSCFKPQAAEYLLGLNTKLIDQIQDRNIAGEFMIVVKNKELSCILQERFNFDLREKLQHAIVQDDTELVGNILVISPELLDSWFDGMPLGHWALKQNKLEVIELILINDINLESKVDNQDRNLLTFALIERKFDIVEVLITKYNFGIGEPLYSMLKDNDSDAIFNIPTSILQQALNHPSISQFLSHPNSASIRDGKDNTALHIAVMYAKEDFIEYHKEELSQMVNEKNQDGQTPLHLLLNKLTGYFAQVKILEQLLDMKNIDVKIPDVEGFTAIDIAANFSPYVLKRFFEKEVVSKLELTDPTYSSCLPLFMEIKDLESIKNTQKEILKSNYPLHYACLQEHQQQIIKLLNDEENYNVPDIWGYFPLYYAICQDNLEVVKILVSRDDIDIIRASNRFNRTTTLHTAIYQDKLDIIKCLFEKAIKQEEGISNLQGQFNRPLIHKIQSPQTAAYLVDLFKKLTKAKPSQYKLLDLNEQDAYGHTALYYASMLPDPRLMDYWFKLSTTYPKQYSIDMSLNQNLICNAAMQGNTNIIYYLLERHGDVFNLDSDANDKLVEMSICGQGPRTLKFLFYHYPKSYLLVKDPSRLKEMALFFDNQELSEYLNDAKLMSILYKHSELRLLEKIEEVEIKYLSKLRDLESKFKDVQNVAERSVFGSMTSRSFDSTKPFLGTIRKKLSDLQKGFETIREQQIEHDQMMVLSGVDERARVQKALQDFKKQEPKLHDYCITFYYGLNTYFTTYKTLSNGAIQTCEDISDTAAKYGIRLFLKASKAASRGLPIVASVVGFLDLVVVGTYTTIQTLKLQNKIQIINDIIQKKSPLEDELSLNIVKAAVAITKLKGEEISLQASGSNKKLEWIEKKLKGLKQNIIGEEIISTPAAALAMQHVGTIIANIYKDYNRIISNDEPLDEMLISLSLNVKPAASPTTRREEARRRSAVNLYMYDKVYDLDHQDQNCQTNYDYNHDKSLIAKDSLMSFSTDSSDS
ncbi:ankyrin repeat domain-containing protein [Candidatus Phycorickettsia trachydisci]|nr:ankyrin repeat domain-containing protein [Candidatus Phycorickettsia trachydisci]